MLARIARVEAQAGPDRTAGQLAARIAQEVPAARLRTTVAEPLIDTGWLNPCRVARSNGFLSRPELLSGIGSCQDDGIVGCWMYQRSSS